MKLLRLRGRKICDRVLKRGTLLKGKTMHCRVLLGAPRHPHADSSTPAVYIGAVASTKLDKSAVKRNRMRRRCREAWRLALKELDEQNNNHPKARVSGAPRLKDTAGGRVGSWEGHQGWPFHASFQLLILPRSSSLGAPFPEIQQDVSRFLFTLRSWPMPPRNAVASSSSR